MDCISLENVTGERTGWAAWSEEAATVAKRYRTSPFKTQATEGGPVTRNDRANSNSTAST
jgi:hypothetical protein